MCGIRLYRGPCRVQYGKKSSRLKNFTPTSQLMQLTIMRYVNPIKSYKDLHSVKNACTRYTQEVYPKPPNILHLSRIWVKCKEVYPRCKEVYPRPPNILHLSRIWVKCKGVWGKSTPNEKDHFHKALPNVKNAYVTLRKFTPDLKIFYTDISAISVTLCNSVYSFITTRSSEMNKHRG